MVYLTNTFSPQMVSKNRDFKGSEVNLEVIKSELNSATSKIGCGFTSAISHEVTGKILSTLLNREIPFNRVNIHVKKHDLILCIIPNFRASEAREFTFEEISEAGFRCFIIEIW